MEGKSATIFVTKLGAAERQLNAAIRMYLDDEELAVHTVGAASYQVLQDLIGKDKHDDAHALFLTALFSIARELATGKRDAIPKKLAHPQIRKIVETIRCGIADGTIKDVGDVVITRSETLLEKIQCSG
jgi:hypothetical protein